MTTPQQYKIYQFIAQYVREHHYAPTLQEIATALGLSPRSKSLISRQLRALERSGWIQFFKKGYRNIQLLNSSPKALPILGRIAAGQPIEAIVEQQTLDISSIFLKEDQFILQVKGDSMIEEGIFHNDYIICKSAKKAEEGEIVIVLIDQQETTLKKISYKIKNFITLIPANAALNSQSYLPERIQIQGIFVGLLRLKK